jgi:hypothetical protein
MFPVAGQSELTSIRYPNLRLNILKGLPVKVISVE